MHRTLGLTLSLGVLAADQATKLIARAHLTEPATLGPSLNLQLGSNTGVMAWMWRERRLAVAAPLALIVGGALGNIVDRVRLGAVTDFIDAHIGDFHWPTFNLADTAITVGVAWLLLTSLGRQASATAPSSPPAKGHP